jgi:hypothetical protein
LKHAGERSAYLLMGATGSLRLWVKTTRMTLSRHLWLSKTGALAHT